jgi:hypothetical protein
MGAYIPAPPLIVELFFFFFESIYITGIHVSDKAGHNYEPLQYTEG